MKLIAPVVLTLTLVTALIQLTTAAHLLVSRRQAVNGSVVELLSAARHLARVLEEIGERSGLTAEERRSLLRATVGEVPGWSIRDDGPVLTVRVPLSAAAKWSHGELRVTQGVVVGVRLVTPEIDA